MPELPEVETVRRGLEPAMVGERFAAIDLRRPDLRFPFPERFTERLTDRRVEGLRRRAKYLIADLDGTELLAHLLHPTLFDWTAPERAFQRLTNGQASAAGVQASLTEA